VGNIDYSLTTPRDAAPLDAKEVQNALMPTMQIRDVPDDVYQGIVAAARAEQRSLSQQAIVELRRALGLGSDDRRAMVIEHLRSVPRRLPRSAPTPEALLREDRDQR
jgi:antitoxin FitA